VHCNVVIPASNTFLVASDTTQTGISGVEHDPRRLPAPSTDGDPDVEYEVPHTVSGGSSGMSPAHGGRRERRELGASRWLPEGGGTGGTGDPAEGRRGGGGRKTNFNIIERDSEYYIRRTA
jgi:hypothetical protein